MGFYESSTFNATSYCNMFLWSSICNLSATPCSYFSQWQRIYNCEPNPNWVCGDHAIIWSRNGGIIKQSNSVEKLKQVYLALVNNSKIFFFRLIHCDLILSKWSLGTFLALRATNTSTMRTLSIARLVEEPYAFIALLYSRAHVFIW